MQFKIFLCSSNNISNVISLLLKSMSAPMQYRIPAVGGGGLIVGTPAAKRGQGYSTFSQVYTQWNAQ